MIPEILWAIGGIAVGAALVWVLARRQPGKESDTAAAHLTSIQRLVGEQMERMTSQLDHRLRENVHAMNESKSFLAERVSATERTVREVSASLGKLENATQALHKTNQEISAFQQMLKNPKIRGNFGEVLLGNLLGEVLAGDQYDLQFTFPGGNIADAVIYLQDQHKVAVDAKFPLANYEAYHRAEEELLKKSLHKEFIRDVKKHVKDIADKYILPQEKTLDIAFMYIPLEGVYYETMMRDDADSDIWQFCIEHRVIPVSPNSLFGYLQTVLIGLRGMKIEEQAKEILQGIGQLRQDWRQFSKEYAMVGTHLTNAKNRFDDTGRRLDKVTNRLEQLEVTNPAPALKEGEEPPVINTV